MGPKKVQSRQRARRGILGACVYDSDDDSDFTPGASSQGKPKRGRSKASRQQNPSHSTLVDTSTDSHSAHASVSPQPSPASCAAAATEADSDSETNDNETLADRRQRLANLQLSTPVGRRRRNAAGQSQQTNTAAGGCVTAGKPPRWGELPTYVLAKIFAAVCSSGALPMAPRLSCVCKSWASTVAETPELWKVLDTQYLLAASSAAGQCSSPNGKARGSPAGHRHKRGAGSSSSITRGGVGRHAAVEAGLRQWVASGRLQELQDLRVHCAGSSHLSLEDPQFFADEEAAAADPAGSGGPIELSGTVLVLMSQRCKCIQRFSLSGSPAFKADELEVALSAMLHLEELKLSGVRITPVSGLDTCIRRFLDEAVRRSNPSLTHLTLESCPLLGKKTIKGLLLPQDHSSRNTSTAASAAASQQNSLVQPSPAQLESAAAPATVRPALPHLLELDLSCSASAIGGSIDIQLDLLQAAMPQLRVLKLSGLGGFYGWTATVRTATKLPGFPHLKVLHVGSAMLQLPSGLLRMGSSYITDAVLMNLASKSPGLTDLDVSGSHVTAEGLAQLAAGLGATAGGGRAAVAQMAVTASAADAAADGSTAAAAVGGLRLQRLYISRSKLAKDAGLQLIGQLCSDTLEELVVRNAGASVGDDGVRGLRGCFKLNSLDMTGSSVTEQGLKDLLSALPNDVLTDLQLGSCRSLSRSVRQAAAAGLDELREALQ